MFFERQKASGFQRASTYWITLQTPQRDGAGAGPTPGAKNSIQVPPVGGRNPKAWTTTCFCLLGAALAGSCSQALSKGMELRSSNTGCEHLNHQPAVPTTFKPYQRYLFHFGRNKTEYHCVLICFPCLLIHFLKRLIYLKDRETERERVTLSVGSPYMATTTGIRLSQSQEPGATSGSASGVKAPSTWAISTAFPGFQQLASLVYK